MKFEDYSRDIKRAFRELMRPVTELLAKFDVHPNALTVLSLSGALLASFEYLRGSLRLAAVWLLLGGLFDVLDGDVARNAHRTSRFGALLDSTLDRYSEGLVFLGICFYFLTFGSSQRLMNINIAASALALIGSFMVSYVRARSEALGVECTVGIMQRPERVITLAIGSLISAYALMLAVYVIMVLTNYTAVQRMCHVRRELKGEDSADVAS